MFLFNKLIVLTDKIEPYKLLNNNEAMNTKPPRNVITSHHIFTNKIKPHYVVILKYVMGCISCFEHVQLFTILDPLSVLHLNNQLYMSKIPI